MERRFVRDRFVVLTTSEVVLEQLHTAAPALTLGLAGWFEGLEDLHRAAQLGCEQIAVPVATGSAWLVQAAQVLGVEAIGWLGNTTDEITTFVEWGVGAIVSDYPSVAKHTLAAR